MYQRSEHLVESGKIFNKWSSKLTVEQYICAMKHRNQYDLVGYILRGGGNMMTSQGRAN